MLRAIREIQPTWVVGENVRGLTNWNGGLVFDEVQANLENEGYEVTPFLLPACAVNAPHRRDRIWFVAYSNKRAKRSSGKSGEIESNWSKNNDEPESRRKQTEQHSGYGNVCKSNSNTNNQGLQRSENIGSIGKSKENRNEFFAGLLPSNWEKFPTQSPICNGNDGFPTELDGITFPNWRNESIKGGGNAIVPNVAYQIFKAIDRL